jgi:hypothetical protein
MGPARGNSVTDPLLSIMKLLQLIACLRQVSSQDGVPKRIEFLGGMFSCAPVVQ